MHVLFRSRFLILIFGIALLGACAQTEAPEGILVERVVEFAPPEPPPPPPPTARVAFVGDIMLARLPGEAVERGEDPFASFGWALRRADLSIGNLECVVATGGQEVSKLYTFRCHPRNLPLLARYFGALSVANNHSGDFGKEAFAEQLELLNSAGIPYAGGGRNLAEAHQPLIVERNGLRLALLAYNEVELRSFAAGPDTPGIAWSEDELVVAGIEAARDLADIVMVYPHWGYEYYAEPSERQRSLARKMIDAGAHLVVGGHPHVTQTVEWYKDGLIVYSLGNFVFDDFMDVPLELDEPSRTSWVLQVTVDQSGVQSWNTLVARTDDWGIPRPVSGVMSPCGTAQSKEIGQCKGD